MKEILLRIDEREIPFVAEVKVQHEMEECL